MLFLIFFLFRASHYCALCHSSQDEEGLFDVPCKCDDHGMQQPNVKAQDFKRTSRCASDAGPARTLLTKLRIVLAPQRKILMISYWIIIIGPLDYLRKEWVELRGIPEIYFFEGYPWAKEVLQVVKLASCQMCVLLNAKPEKPDPRFDFAFEMLKTISSRLVRTRNLAAMMYDPVDGQCNFSQRLPVLVSRITDEPETPVSDILAVAVGQTIPPALCHSFAYLNYGRSDVLSFACTLMQGGLSPKSLVEQGYDEVQVRLLDPVDLKEEAINCIGTYEEVFCSTLHSNMLCLGLYRQVNLSVSAAIYDI
ncbi:calcium-activated potassium channel slowpoke-like [Penaeus monodon]|uniref:calcium-activated potassium channel slowpoke-like n=1 Tax=Penaeus monodon TaxID=6687 RepID=UPI0018A7BF66|nr:calcium-activated potassium channel slowpoke-like [Penaeus monodon]